LEAFEARSKILDVAAGAVNQMDLSSLVHSLRDRHNLAHVGYHGVNIRGLPPRSAVIIATCNPEWVRRYLAREYHAIDPALKLARQSILPIDWTTIDRRSFDTRRYYSELAEFEIGHWGCSIPLHTPTGDFGIFTFTSNVAEERLWLEQRRNCKFELFTLAHYLHAKAIDFTQSESFTDQITKLSTQVRICLELLTQGHKPSAIAERIGISVHTVRKHLIRGKEAMQASSPMEAAMKAQDMGLIRGRRQIAGGLEASQNRK